MGRHRASSTVDWPRWRTRESAVRALDEPAHDGLEQLGHRSGFNESGEHTDDQAGHDQHQCVLGRRLTSLTQQQPTDLIHENLRVQRSAPCRPA